LLDEQRLHLRQREPGAGIAVAAVGQVVGLDRVGVEVVELALVALGQPRRGCIGWISDQRAAIRAGVLPQPRPVADIETGEHRLDLGRLLDG
jgi:hypothetical protein